MAKINKTHLIILFVFLLCVIVVSIQFLHKPTDHKSNYSLTDTISKIVSEYPGEIGVAVIVKTQVQLRSIRYSFFVMKSLIKEVCVRPYSTINDYICAYRL